MKKVMIVATSLLALATFSAYADEATTAASPATPPSAPVAASPATTSSGNVKLSPAPADASTTPADKMGAPIKTTHTAPATNTTSQPSSDMQ